MARGVSILLFHRVDNRIEAIRIGTALPVRDVKRLTRLLCDKIETIDPGFGIEIMRLAATLAEPLAPKQTISSLTEEPEADVSGLIDTLANRVGEQQLYRFAPVASDVPERSVAADRADGARYRRDLARLPIGRAPRACCRHPSRSRRSRCCPIIRPSASPGAAYAGA